MLKSQLTHHGLLLALKYAYQRATRGYDDTIYWSFDGYFDTFVEPLEKFCREYLSEWDEETLELNQEKTEIMKETLRLIEYQRKNTGFCGASGATLWSYVGKNIGWYWD